jgi:hypothetical protein
MRLKATIAVAVLLGSMFVAPPALADSPPGACREHDFGISYGRACFEWSGDDFWVRDNSSNGWSVRAQIEESYHPYRVRWCVNSESAPNWHECRYDMSEGQWIRWRLFEQNGQGGPTRNWTAWSYWHCASNGLPDWYGPDACSI